MEQKFVALFYLYYVYIFNKKALAIIPFEPNNRNI